MNTGTGSQDPGSPGKAATHGAYGLDDRSQLRACLEDQGRPETCRCGKEGHIRFRGRKTYEHLDSGTHESVHKDVPGAFQEEDAVFFEGHRDDERVDRPVQDCFNFCSGHESLNKIYCLNGVKQRVTPAMMTGIADDVWTLRRLMEFPYRSYINQL